MATSRLKPQAARSSRANRLLEHVTKAYESGDSFAGQRQWRPSTAPGTRRVVPVAKTVAKAAGRLLGAIDVAGFVLPRETIDKMWQTGERIMDEAYQKKTGRPRPKRESA